MALRDAGQAAHVTCHIDNLALGPIDPPDPQVRLNWFAQELGWTDYQRVWNSTEAFWREAVREPVRKVAWLSLRSAIEYTGFLEWLWRLDGAPCEVVDLTDMPVKRRCRAFSLAQLSPEEIVASHLWDNAAPLDEAARQRFCALWRQLRADNAPLRAVGADGLQSAPITFFDQQLLSFVSASWQKPSRIVAEVVSEWVEPPMEPYFQAGDGILFARIFALVEAGVLEVRGDLTDIWQSEVRLIDPGQRSTSE